MDADRLLLRLRGRSAEEATRVATAAPGVAGFAVGADLLAGPGPGIVGVVARVGPVAVLWALHGGRSDIVEASTRFVEYGASWVAVHASAGGEAVAAAVAATRGSGGGVAAWVVDPGLDDATVAGMGMARSRGRLVSRLAAVARDARAGAVVCSPEDLGVIAEVAPDLKRIVVGASTPGEVDAALTRGAELVVVTAETLASQH